MNKNVRNITETGAMIAIILVVQILTKMAGQYVTGSLVNMVLALSVSLCSLGCGIVVAILSPFLAFALGIGPAFLPLVPAISLGNLVLVLVSYVLIGIVHDVRHQDERVKQVIGAGLAPEYERSFRAGKASEGGRSFRAGNGMSVKRAVPAILLPALAKFATLYVLVAKLIVPSLGLETGKAAAISAMFSYPQLITALVGMSLASLTAGRIKKGLGR